MAPHIEIYDTTLRDGTQGEGVTFSVTDKLRVAEILGVETVAEYAERPELVTTLAEIGIHYVQGYAVAKPRPLDNLLAGL